MRWFSKKTETRDISSTSIFALGGNPTGSYLGRNAEKASTAVIACVNLISHTMGLLKPVIKDAQGNVIENHTLAPILRSPSRDLSWAGWLTLMVMEYLVVSGNAISVLTNTDGRLQLTYVPWQDVLNYDGKHYYLRMPTVDSRLNSQYNSEQNYRHFPAEQVLHWRYLTGSTDGGFTGQAVVQRAASAIKLAGVLQEAVLAYFQNNCAPSGVFKIKQKLTPDQLKTLQITFGDNYQGAARSGKPLILHGDADYQQVGADARNSELVDQRRFAISEVARIFGVPLAFLASDLTTTTYASAYEQRHALLMNLQGYIQSFSSAFNIKFLSPNEEFMLDDTEFLQKFNAPDQRVEPPQQQMEVGNVS